MEFKLLMGALGGPREKANPDPFYYIGAQLYIDSSNPIISPGYIQQKIAEEKIEADSSHLKDEEEQSLKSRIKRGKHNHVLSPPPIKGEEGGKQQLREISYHFYTFYQIIRNFRSEQSNNQGFYKRRIPRAKSELNKRRSNAIGISRFGLFLMSQPLHWSSNQKNTDAEEKSFSSPGHYARERRKKVLRDEGNLLSFELLILSFPIVQSER